jgi:hypothetical protein
MKLDQINMGTIWTMMTGLVLCVMYMFNTFATAADVEKKVNELELAINYGQYYDRLDDYDEAMAEGNEDLAKEYKRQMERVKAKICEADSEWERCDDK